MFMFVHLTKRTKFLVRVRLFIKRTNRNRFPAAQFMKRALSVRFVSSPTSQAGKYCSREQNQKLTSTPGITLRAR
ncbi:hypothetical protein HanRHA438_Chr03g0143761 [Helianthus annuus]|nr:hypothetical protein HanRHA438_Chr03g0143761 [Helianthus annuus]